MEGGMLRVASVAAPSAPFFVLRPSMVYSSQFQPRWNTFLSSYAQSHEGVVSLCRRSPIFSNSSSDPIEFAPASSHQEDTESIVKQELQREFHLEDMARDKDIEIEVLKVEGKNNRRMIRSRVRVDADLNSVWRVLTDYESLSNFIPGLAVNQLLEKKQNFARLYQVGEQNLPLGLKFHAKGVLECYEGELKDTSIARRRNIVFKMVEGDFQTFEGRWSIEQIVDDAGEDDDHLTVQEYKTTLSYVVELEPKLWLPIRLLEGRVCREIKINLICIRDEAQRIQKLGCEVLNSWKTDAGLTESSEMAE